MWDATVGWLPRGIQLSDRSFARRHRSVRAVLWVQFVITGCVTFANWPAPGAAIVLGAGLAISLCDLALTRRRIRASVALSGLFAYDQALILALSSWHEIEMILVVTLAGAALYQSWRPFVAVYLMVTAHFLFFTGEAVVFRGADWGLVTIAALVQLSLWRAMETARLRNRTVEAAVLESEEQQLRIRAELADRKREAV
jgi:hypothetical protein